MKTWMVLFLMLTGSATLVLAQAKPVQKEINLKAVAGLKFDLTRISVRPGERIRLTLTNADEMDHNLVITKPSARLQVVDAAHRLGASGPKQNYVPESEKVLWSIPVVTPGQSAYILFDAPSQEAVYPYVCTFPGHWSIMNGVMKVVKSKTAL